MFRYVTIWFNLTITQSNDIGNLLSFILKVPMSHKMMECNLNHFRSLKSELSEDLHSKLRSDLRKDSFNPSHFLTTDGTITLRDALRRALISPNPDGSYVEQVVNNKFIDLLTYVEYQRKTIPFFDRGIQQSLENIDPVDPTRIIIPDCDFFFATDMAPEVINTVEGITYDLKCLILFDRNHFIVHYYTNQWYEYDDTKYGSLRNENLEPEFKHPQLNNPYQRTHGHGDYEEKDFMLSVYIRR